MDGFQRLKQFLAPEAPPVPCDPDPVADRQLAEAVAGPTMWTRRCLSAAFGLGLLAMVVPSCDEDEIQASQYLVLPVSSQATDADSNTPDIGNSQE